MKPRVKVEIPLSGISADGKVKTDTFTVSPPCFYCGAPVGSAKDPYYTLKGEYTIQHWGKSRRERIPMLGDVIDMHDNRVKGRYLLKIAYCPIHIEPIKTFSILNVLMITLGALLGFGITAMLYANGLAGGQLILLLFAAPLALAGLFYVLGLGIKAIIVSVNPELQDYPLREGHYGICTHGVRVDGGEPGQGPIRYFLKLSICKPEGAQRLLADIPSAKVVEGQDLLDSNSQ